MNAPQNAAGPGRTSGARSVAFSLVNRVGVVALNMATGILTARVLAPAGRGELSAMNLWPLFLANVTALGTPSALIYFLRQARGEEAAGGRERGELVATALAMVISLSLLAVLVGTLALPHWLHRYPPKIVHFAQLFLLAAPLWAVQITGQAALEALELFAWSNLAQILIPLTTLAGLVPLALTGHLTPVAAAACYTLGIVPTACLIALRLWRRRAARVLAVSSAAARRLLGYGVRSAPLDLLGTLNLYVDQVLVIGLLSASAMGGYAVVLSLSRALLVFQSAIVMVLFPKAAGRPVEQILAMVGHAGRAAALVTGAAALLAMLLGPVLLRVLYGAQYLGAVPAMRLLLAEVVLQGAVVVVSQAFMATGRPGTVSLLQGTGLALAVPLMFVFIPRLGVAGAALALLVSTATRLTLILLAVPMVMRQPLPRLLPGWADVRRLGALALRRAA